MSRLEVLSIINIGVLLILLLLPLIKPLLKKSRLWNWFKNEEKLLSKLPASNKEYFVLCIKPSKKLLEELEKSHFKCVVIDKK